MIGPYNSKIISTIQAVLVTLQIISLCAMQILTFSNDQCVTVEIFLLKILSLLPLCFEFRVLSLTMKNLRNPFNLFLSPPHPPKHTRRCWISWSCQATKQTSSHSLLFFLLFSLLPSAYGPCSLTREEQTDSAVIPVGLLTDRGLCLAPVTAHTSMFTVLPSVRSLGFDKTTSGTVTKTLIHFTQTIRMHCFNIPVLKAEKWSLNGGIQAPHASFFLKHLSGQLFFFICCLLHTGKAYGCGRLACVGLSENKLTCPRLLQWRNSIETVTH